MKMKFLEVVTTPPDIYHNKNVILQSGAPVGISPGRMKIKFESGRSIMSEKVTNRE